MKRQLMTTIWSEEHKVYGFVSFGWYSDLESAHSVLRAYVDENMPSSLASCSLRRLACYFAVGLTIVEFKDSLM